MKKAITNEAISSLCMGLSLLLHGGLSAEDALRLLAEESEEPQNRVLKSMAKQMEEGETLSAAMKREGCFPSYVCGLTETGERTGRLEEALHALADYYEEKVQTERRVRNALLYPAIMLTLMLVVIAVILIRVLHVFNQVYESLGGRLTGVAAVLLNLGTLLGKAMPVLWGLLALAAVFLAVFSLSTAFRTSVLGIWRHRNGDKGVSRKMNNARIARALAMSMASGLQAEEALELAEGMFDDIPAAKCRVKECRACLENGSAIEEAMMKSGLIPAAKCHLLKLGYKSGVQDATMDKIAADLAEESATALEGQVSRIEPALVLICSLLVGLILLSVMLPLTHIMTSIG